MDDGAGGDVERLRRFASLMVAMIDGLAVQKLLDPDGVDLEPLLGTWEAMVGGLSRSATASRRTRRRANVNPYLRTHAFTPL